MSVDFEKIYWADLKENFDPRNDADSSPFRYAEAVIKLTDYLLKILDECRPEYAAAISEIKKVRQQAISLENDLVSFKDWSELAELEKAPRPSFALLTEALVRKIQHPFEATVRVYLDQKLLDGYSSSELNTPRYNETLRELVQYFRMGHLSLEVATCALEELTSFRNKVDACYRRDRRYETKPLIPEFQAKIGEIAAALENPEERRWLEDWAKNLK